MGQPGSTPSKPRPARAGKPRREGTAERIPMPTGKIPSLILDAWLILLALFLPPYLGPLTFRYDLGFMTALLGMAGAALLFSRREDGPYRLNRTAVYALLALSLVAAEALGGLLEKQNLALVLGAITLIGLLAHPFHALYALLLLFGSALLSQGPHLGLGLPGLAAAAPEWNGNRPPLSDLLVPLFPALNAAGLLLLLLGFKRPAAWAPVASAVKTPLPGAGRTAEKNPPETGAGPAPAAAGTALMERPQDEGDPSVTQFFSRVYLEKQGEQALEDMKDILNTVVYFMSRNFKAYSAIGFLASEVGEKLVVNAVVTKSKDFKYDCIIEPGRGLVGNAIAKPGGFVSGNLRSYQGELEYYTREQSINSMMVMRVMDNQSRRLQGLLVVDSEHVRAFTDEHKELMNRFTQIASAMITNAKLTYEMNKQATLADTQYEIAKRLSETIKAEEVIEVLLQSLSKSFAHDRIVICTYDAAASKGMVWRLIGDAGGIAEGMAFDVQSNRSLYGSIFRNRRALVSQNFRQDDRYVRFEAEEAAALKPEDILLAPIYDDRQAVLAVVGIESNRAGAYSLVELQQLKTMMANVSTSLTKARMYTEMERMATMDGLTQIANHRKFQDILTTELGRAQRYSLPLTLLLMDIDHFKKFNDTYGHPVGDLVLQAVARTLQASIRSSDYCARYGGEEFVVVLVQTDEQQAHILAERIRRAIEAAEVPAEDKVLRVTVSIGSATFPQDGLSKQDLIDNADKAMYYSKQNGRNRVSFYSQVRQRVAGPKPVPA